MNYVKTITICICLLGVGIFVGSQINRTGYYQGYYDGLDNAMDCRAKGGYCNYFKKHKYANKNKKLMAMLDDPTKYSEENK